jgi:hypothetical protein
MDINQRQIALSLLEGLREDLMYAHLNNGSRILNVADLRQYIYERMGRIRTNALVMDDLYGDDNGHGQGLSKSNGHNGTLIHTEESGESDRLDFAGGTTSRRLRSTSHHLGKRS